MVQGWCKLWNLWEWNKIQGLSGQSLSCVRLCDPMDCSTPGFPVHHQLLELAQTHVHQVGDNLQPSYPLSSPSPPTFNLSLHLGLFQWVSSLHQVAKLLELQLQHQSFQWIFRTDFFRIDWSDLLAVQGTLKSSPTPQIKSINSSALSFLYSPTLTSIHNYRGFGVPLFFFIKYIHIRAYIKCMHSLKKNTLSLPCLRRLLIIPLKPHELHGLSGFSVPEGIHDSKLCFMLIISLAFFIVLLCIYD